MITTSSGREQIIYTIDVLRDNVDRGLEILADSILHPSLLQEEIDMTKNILRFQSEDLMENPQAMLQEVFSIFIFN